MEDTLKAISEFLAKPPADALVNLAGTLLVTGLGFIAIRYICRLLDSGLSRSKMDKSIVSFLNSFVSIGLKMLLVLMAAMQLGVPGATLVTVLGSCGLAIGLALQGSLTNLAGGLMILIFHPFKVGHYIQSGSDAGTVREIGILYTTLETLERKTVVLPNGALAGGVVTNFSVSPLRRIDLNLTLLPDAPVDTVCAILDRAARSHPKVRQEAGIEARLYDITGGVMVYGLRAFTLQEDFWDTKLDLTERIAKDIRQAGLQFAPPQVMIAQP